MKPRGEYGYLCYTLTYQATNSYGGYTRGSSMVVYRAYKGMGAAKIPSNYELIRSSETQGVLNGRPR